MLEYFGRSNIVVGQCQSFGNVLATFIFPRLMAFWSESQLPWIVWLHQNYRHCKQKKWAESFSGQGARVNWFVDFYSL